MLKSFTRNYEDNSMNACFQNSEEVSFQNVLKAKAPSGRRNMNVHSRWRRTNPGSISTAVPTATNMSTRCMLE